MHKYPILCKLHLPLIYVKLFYEQDAIEISFKNSMPLVWHCIAALQDYSILLLILQSVLTISGRYLNFDIYWCISDTSFSASEKEGMPSQLELLWICSSTASIFLSSNPIPAQWQSSSIWNLNKMTSLNDFSYTSASYPSSIVSGCGTGNRVVSWEMPSDVNGLSVMVHIVMPGFSMWHEACSHVLFKACRLGDQSWEN